MQRCRSKSGKRGARSGRSGKKFIVERRASEKERRRDSWGSCEREESLPRISVESAAVARPLAALAYLDRKTPDLSRAFAVRLEIPYRLINTDSFARSAGTGGGEAAAQRRWQFKKE